MDRATRLTFIFVCTCLFSGLMLLLAGEARAGRISPSLEDRLASAAENEQIPVIVHFTDPPVFKKAAPGQKSLMRRAMLVDLKDRTRKKRNALGNLMKKLGVSRERSLWIVNGVALKATPAAIRALARRGEVEDISTDGIVLMSEPAVASMQAVEWDLSAIHATDLWSLGITGQGVVVASMDSGVDVNHPDLAPRYRGGNNSWFDPNGQHATPYDSAGHGTKSMGLILAGNASGTDLGVAPGARWIAVKVFNDLGQSTISGFHQGYQWFLDPDGDPNTDDAPDVVNNSWGLATEAGLCVSEFAQDLAALEAAGIVNVFAGGNTGPNAGTSVSPGNNPYALSVGSVGTTLTVSFFSARGPGACDLGVYPSLVAPGESVVTTDLSSGGLFPATATVSGTSFSSAQVAGVACLLKSAFPNLTPAQVRQALTGSALDLGAAGPDNTYGHGMVDALAAYQSLAPNCTVSVAASVAPSPPVVNQPALFSSQVFNGTAPYAYSWDVDGDGTQDCAAADCPHTFPNFIHTTATVTVEDANGCQAADTVPVSVGIRIAATVKNRLAVPLAGAPVFIAQYPAQRAVTDINGGALLSGPQNQRISLTVEFFAGGAGQYAATANPYFTTGAADTASSALALALSDLAAAAIQAGADTALGAVYGRVADGSGNPLAGARAKLLNAQGNQIPCTAVYRNDSGTWDPGLNQTGASGEFFLSDVPGAPRDLFAAASLNDWAFGQVEVPVVVLGAARDAVTAVTVKGVSFPSTQAADGRSGASAGSSDKSSGGGGCFLSTVSAH